MRVTLKPLWVIFVRRAAKTNKILFTGAISLLLMVLSAPAAGPQQDYVPGELIIKFRGDVADLLQAQLVQKKTPNGLSLSPELDKLGKKYKLRRIKPLFKDFKQKRQKIQDLKAGTRHPVSKTEKRILKRLARVPKSARVPNLGGIHRVEFDPHPDLDLAQLAKQYEQSGDVEYAELNYIVSICREPNDPLYKVQWPLENTGQLYPTSGKFNDPPGTPDSDIDALTGWRYIRSAPNTVVAVVDTGLDYNHRDIVNNVWINEAELYGHEGLDDDENGYADDICGYDFLNGDGNPIDDHGHGTHCAGIIAAESDNDLDISGVCWRAQIMVLKCLGSDGRGDLTAAAEAVYYAVENGADVISNSWGGSIGFQGLPKPLMEAYDYAYSQGVISVAAAGNQGSTLINFPAIFDSVIAVAATDSNDDLASFSNYGDLVDIAAPGVDVLSLRAAGTYRGAPYNQYTTIISGTSQACPHVSAALALVLAYYPGIDIDEARDIVFENCDYLPVEICKWGRLNLGKALSSIGALYAGDVVFTSSVYSCSTQIRIILNDLSLAGVERADVYVTTSGGDIETVTLSGDSDLPGAFAGSIPTDSGEPNEGDGKVQLAHGQKITVTYEDLDDGTGAPAIVTDTAVADCEPAVVSNVQIDVPGPEPTVTFTTSERTAAFVVCSFDCGGPYVLKRSGSAFTTSHTVNLRGVEPYTDYFFTVQVFDIAENETTEDNNGLCYAFTTTGPADMYVPGEYPNIQEAIYRAWDRGVVWLADGVYTGDGNRDIDFMGKAITVRSENGPQNCIIDCNGTEQEPHIGFVFDDDEDSNSVLAGVTVTGGCGAGAYSAGAIACVYSSPVIAGCVISGNTAAAGGGLNCKSGTPTISNCILTGNTAIYGGAIFSQKAAPIISNCVITANTANKGGALASRQGSPKVVNCTIVGNRANLTGGGIFFWYGEEVVTNSIIWNNSAPSDSQLFSYSSPSYCCIQDWAGQGIGNIAVDPCFVAGGHWNPNGTADDPNDDFWVEGDYYLKSEGWRWSSEFNQWTWDGVTSRCIDAGNPGSKLLSEPLTLDVDPSNRIGRNSRLNMGAYGGTAYASMPPHEWTVLADLTNDGVVDLLDLQYWSESMLAQGSDLPGDLNRNEIVNMADFALLADRWSRKTSWYAP
ncbi:MAG: S8 family serine peptidase [Deltaproteobacteria bacterium]|nr:S8 family serine peptidase [Deltaproteobacteria bacterium]